MSQNQQHTAAGGDRDDHDDDVDNVSGAGQAQIDTQGTDDLLDEIDGLLENNAEEFVNAYVQKGGQ